MIFLLCTWFDVWAHADIIRVGNRNELVISTIASCLGIITSLIGWAGILLNNRSFLAVYTFLLWICFTLLVVPGYTTFKRRNFNLDGKVNFQWANDFGINDWLRIQNQLNCCGFFSPFVEAAVSQVCYSRSVLPGCKGPYMEFERFVLERWYTIAFGLVPFQIAVIVVGLLCSNHITYRFGKGLMPKAYRLSMNSMAVIMDNYARCVSRFMVDFFLLINWRFAVNWLNSTARTSQPRSLRDPARIYILIPLPCLTRLARRQVSRHWRSGRILACLSTAAERVLYSDSDSDRTLLSLHAFVRS